MGDKVSVNANDHSRVRQQVGVLHAAASDRVTARLADLRERVKAAELEPSTREAANSAIDAAEQSARQLVGSLGRFHDLFDTNSDLVRRADEIVSMLVAKP